MCANENVSGVSPKPFIRTNAETEAKRLGYTDQQIKNMTDEQLINAIKNGTVRPVDDAKPTDKLEEKPPVGTTVERQGQPDKNVVSQTSTTTFKLADLMQAAGLDESKKDSLVKAFTEAGIKVDEQGNVAYADKAKFDTAYTKFAKENRMTYIQFEGDDNNEVANDLSTKKSN